MQMLSPTRECAHEWNCVQLLHVRTFLATHRKPEKRIGAHPFAILQPAPEHQHWCALVAAVEMAKWMPLSVSQTLGFGSVEEGCSLYCSDAL